MSISAISKIMGWKNLEILKHMRDKLVLFICDRLAAESELELAKYVQQSYIANQDFDMSMQIGIGAIDNYRGQHWEDTITNDSHCYGFKSRLREEYYGYRLAGGKV